MQDFFGSHEDYLRRTDYLAARIGVNVQDLPGIVDVSRASLFSYRAGKRSIPPKAWHKLAAAEEAAGLRRSPEANETEMRRDDTAASSEAPAATMAEAFQKLGEALDMLKTLMENMPKEPKP